MGLFDRFKKREIPSDIPTMEITIEKRGHDTPAFRQQVRAVAEQKRYEQEMTKANAELLKLRQQRELQDKRLEIQKLRQVQSPPMFQTSRPLERRFMPSAPQRNPFELDMNLNDLFGGKRHRVKH